MDADEDAFDPDQDARDYREVAQSLPVYCVSSRAYQKLSGRLKNDSVLVEGFIESEDTEIPGLQEHAIRMTEEGRIRISRRFLNDLAQLLSSMKLWSGDDGRVPLNSKEQSDQKTDEAFLRAKLMELQRVSGLTASLFSCRFVLTATCQDLATAVQESITTFQEALTTQLFENFDRLIPEASSKAVTIARYVGSYDTTC